MLSFCHPLIIQMDNRRKESMLREHDLLRENSTIAKRKWPKQTDRTHIRVLATLTRSFQFSIAFGDLLLLNSAWYVTHSGLLRVACRMAVMGIAVEPEQGASSAG